MDCFSWQSGRVITTLWRENSRWISYALIKSGIASEVRETARPKPQATSGVWGACGFGLGAHLKQVGLYLVYSQRTNCKPTHAPKGLTACTYVFISYGWSLKCVGRIKGTKCKHEMLPTHFKLKAYKPNMSGTRMYLLRTNSTNKKT